MSRTARKTSYCRDAFALLFAIVFPSIVTWVYFYYLRNSPSSYQQLAFAGGKLLQFGFPICYVWLFYRERLSGWLFLRRRTRNSGESHDAGNLPRSPSASLGLAIAFGVAVAVAMIAIYATLLPADIAVKLKMLVTQKVVSLGIDSNWKFFGLGIFYSICHSFLEEYYWRWFVFDGLRKFFAEWAANVISSIGFMAHHVILLGVYFGWQHPLTYALSLSVATGGAFWAWLYARDQHLRNAWLSHAIVDAAIFGFGYYLVQDAF